MAGLDNCIDFGEGGLCYWLEWVKRNGAVVVCGDLCAAVCVCWVEVPIYAIDCFVFGWMEVGGRDVDRMVHSESSDPRVVRLPGRTRDLSNLKKTHDSRVEKV